MKLKSIQIKNYRSVENVIFEIDELDDKTFTYGLIGVNEVGKSTILKALSLKDGLKNETGQQLPLQKDFKNKDNPIEIEYFYSLDQEEIDKCKEHLKIQDPIIDAEKENFTQAKIKISFILSSLDQPQSELELIKIKSDNDQKIIIQEKLKPVILDMAHRSIFWTAESRYLISQPINLSEFSTNPDAISIPLKNCFYLAGIKNIQDRVNSLIGDSTEVEQLETDLGEKVTRHIKSVWPKHPIKITFKISDGLINFHVKDSNSKGKAKTADQRSDGFKQFISFLLTVSAQNRNEELSNSILLLDEPETHLHPQAQEDLLRELIKITQNDRNNVTFFATHSNYMIDKNDLSRNYRITKPNDSTEKDRLDKKTSTYASVTYEVFEIPSGDYHNQLYDSLREKYSSTEGKDLDEVNILEFDNGFFQQKKGLKPTYPCKKRIKKVTLPTYIRNTIHYPENKDTNFEKNLQESIELMKSYE